MAKVRSKNDVVKFKSIGWKNPSSAYRKMVVHTRTLPYSTTDCPKLVVSHIRHPRELTEEVLQELRDFQDAGIFVMNQTPIIRGVNDDPFVLAELLKQARENGMISVYFIVDRPSEDNRSLPLASVCRLVEEASARTPEFGETARLYLNHPTGQIEILAIEDGKAYLKYRQTDDGCRNKLMIVDCPDYADWIDDRMLHGQQRNQAIMMDDEDSEDDLMSLPPGSIANQYFIDMSD
jgi:hypothetical protein